MSRKPADQGGLAGTIGGDQAEIEGDAANVWRQCALDSGSALAETEPPV